MQATLPPSMYLIRSEADRTGQESPGRVLTILAIANQTIGVIGPVLGGLLIDLGGWQSTFLVNIPLSIACIILGYIRFPKIAASLPEQEKKRVSIDFMGIAFFAFTLISLLLFLMNPSWHAIYLLIMAAVMGFFFVILELKIKEPFIDLRVLGSNTSLLLTYSRGILSALISYSFIYSFPQWLEQGRGLTPSHAGLLLLPMFLGAMIVSKLTGKSPAIRMKLIVGSLVQLIAISLLLFIRPSSSLYFLGLIVLLLGVPQGLLNLAIQNAVYFQAVREQIGASAGLLRTFMYMGAILASCSNGLFLKDEATAVGIHHISVFCICAGLLLITITLMDRSLIKVGRNRLSES
ncbi:MFS transporter [Bacillus massiliglaciei]|uniref:MFS transporter n=1 Tax=Bacillus massiliglaciei TaxID=1816693 RepID=UPI00227713BC|nr:MFS transporter [Bacillus massiliglaciei]